MTIINHSSNKFTLILDYLCDFVGKKHDHLTKEKDGDRKCEEEKTVEGKVQKGAPARFFVLKVSVIKLTVCLRNYRKYCN